jgi:hypothetical protein
MMRSVDVCRFASHQCRTSSGKQLHTQLNHTYNEGDQGNDAAIECWRKGFIA